jgi:hypothetical protein
MFVRLIDPHGLDHVVLIDEDGFHGAENIAHHVEDVPPGARMAAIESIVVALANGRELPHGMRRA